MTERSLVSITDYSKKEIMEILNIAAEFEANPNSEILKNRVIATLFFEPSTRTRLSFETAVNRLRGRIIGFTDALSSSSVKGETLHDTILMVASYADAIVMRHPLEGAARYASEISPVPIINAGDGANQHPSQTLLDLYSILKTQGTLENLHICLVGDLKYGRTVHSLIMAMSHFKPTFRFIAPKELRMPKEYREFCRKRGIPFEETFELNGNFDDADILYITRVQKERFLDLIEFERVRNVYTLRRSMLENTKDNMKIMHPLPRVNEIDQDVDSSEKAYYFSQAQNGLYVRQAILSKVLNLKP